MEKLVLTEVFDLDESDYNTWRKSPADAARIIWEAKTQRIKLSNFAENFFRDLAKDVGGQMLLRKGELHRLVAYSDPNNISSEVSSKLDELNKLFLSAIKHEEVEVES